jgi:hypothetical protein
VNDERQHHPLPHVRGKMQVLWLLHCGATREGRCFSVHRAALCPGV